MSNIKKIVPLIITILFLVFGLVACGKAEIIIDFVVDGEVHESISIQGDSKIELPKAPQKEGYSFKGWFFDKDIFSIPFNENSLVEKASTENFTVYAKFEKNSEIDNETPNVKEDFSNISFSNKEYEYNGKEQRVLISGTLPLGATVTYKNNTGVNAGNYEATATLEKEGLERVVLNATLIISKANIKSITLKNKTVSWTNREQILEITGTIPTGVSIEYSGGAESNNGAIVPGSYNIIATLQGSNYNDLILTATLTILDTFDRYNVTFSEKTVPYDGTKQEILISSDPLPQGTIVTYVRNEATDAGEYEANVTLEKEGFTPLSITSTLKIEKIDISGITLEGKTQVWTGREIQVDVIGLFDDISVSYSGGSTSGNSSVEPGTYEITARLISKNYNELVLKTNLIILDTFDRYDIQFENKTVVYNGHEHSVEITSSPLPEETSIIYGNNKGINAGTYKATVAISKQGLGTLSLNATMEIEKAEIIGVSLLSKTITWTGDEEKVEVSGAIPTGVSVSYEGGGNSPNGSIEPGIYTIKATLQGINYLGKVVSATLTIKDTFNRYNIKFENKAVTYNGEEHSIEITSDELPAGTTIVYTNNKGTIAGEYDAFVILSKSGLDEKTLYATLTIAKITMKGITFENRNIEYNGDWHVISVVGNIPSGSTVTYLGGEDGVNAVKNPGEYTINVTVENPNYETVVYTSDVKVSGTEEDLNMTVFNNSLYFQNPLDKNRLYKTSGNNLNRINKDRVSSFAISSTGSYLYYVSSSLLANSIKKIENAKVDNLLKISGEEIVVDNSNLYFSVNGLLNSENQGIYKINLASLNSGDGEPIKISTQKGEYLTSVGDYIYFSNKSDGGKLYRVNKSGATENELVYDRKVSEIISDNNDIFFVAHMNLSNWGAAIYKIKTNVISSLPIDEDSSAFKKITNAKGTCLTVIGNDLYFINIDWITTNTFGEGIYKVNKESGNWISGFLGGTRLDIETSEYNKIYNLVSDGSNLYFYRTSNKHVYKYNISSKVETDLLDGFTPPEEFLYEFTTYYEKLTEYNGELYYINMRDNGSLYKYSLASNNEYKLIDTEVADFAINDGYLYYTTVSFKINFALHKMRLVDGSSTKISDDKAMNLIFVDDKIYYTNFSSKNSLSRMNLDGSEDETLYSEDTEAIGLYKDKGTTVQNYPIYFVNGKIYFVATRTKKSLLVIPKEPSLFEYNIEIGRVTEYVDISPNEYIIVDDVFYGMHNTLNNYFYRHNLQTGEGENIMNLGATNDARGIFQYDGYVYFYRNVAAGSANRGLYRVNLSSSNNKPELVGQFNGYYITNVLVEGSKLYFIDVWQVFESLPTPASTGNLCVLDLNTNQITVLTQG